MFSAFNPSKWSSGQPTLQRPGSSWGFGHDYLMDRALDLKPEVTQGCGFESRLWQEVSMTEVRPYPLGHDCLMDKLHDIINYIYFINKITFYINILQFKMVI